MKRWETHPFCRIKNRLIVVLIPQERLPERVVAEILFVEGHYWNRGRRSGFRCGHFRDAGVRGDPVGAQRANSRAHRGRKCRRPVPQAMEEIIEAKQHVPFEQLQKYTVELVAVPWCNSSTRLWTSPWPCRGAFPKTRQGRERLKGRWCSSWRR